MKPARDRDDRASSPQGGSGPDGTQRHRAWLLGAAGLGLIALVPLAMAATEPPTRLQGSVVSIGDGDTLRIRRGTSLITVRLACIDAPELAQAPWGQRARASLLRRLPIGSTVTLLVKETDRFGRTVAEVIGAVNLGLALVEDGQAFAYRRYLGACRASDYLEAEARARRQRRGVWQIQEGLLRPWEFRHAPRTPPLPDGTTPDGRRYRCDQIGSSNRAQQLLQQGHQYLDKDGDGRACESLP